jgi:hypothetical protein
MSHVQTTMPYSFIVCDIVGPGLYIVCDVHHILYDIGSDIAYDVWLFCSRDPFGCISRSHSGSFQVWQCNDLLQCTAHQSSTPIKLPGRPQPQGCPPAQAQHRRPQALPPQRRLPPLPRRRHWTRQTWYSSGWAHFRPRQKQHRGCWDPATRQAPARLWKLKFACVVPRWDGQVQSD